MASSAPTPLYRQVKRGSALQRARARLQTVSYPFAAASGAALGTLMALGRHLDRLLPSLNPQPPAGKGLGGDLLLDALFGALMFVGALALKRGLARLYLRARFGERAP